MSDLLQPASEPAAIAVQDFEAMFSWTSAHPKSPTVRRTSPAVGRNHEELAGERAQMEDERIWYVFASVRRHIETTWIFPARSFLHGHL
jgi:hypothetical protein